MYLRIGKPSVVWLALCIIGCRSEPVNERYERFTKSDLSQIELALNLFKKFHGRFPTQSEGLAPLKSKYVLPENEQSAWQGPYANFLRTGTNDEIIDLWGNKIEYEVTGTDQIEITSRGKDGVLGTYDDIKHTFKIHESFDK